ncbi:MAG: glycosyltransferase family 39 protein [Elusimicrobia bacterium]|nr:glycosyltransferase family 39 protein [Elusimicrobiota bacterium]
MGKKRKEAPPAGLGVPAADGAPFTRGLVFIAVLLAGWAWFAGQDLVLPFVPAAWKVLGRGLYATLADGDPFGLLAPKLAWVAALWFVAAGLGGPICLSLGLKGNKAELFLLTAGLGFGVLSLLLLALGAAGFFSPKALKVVFCLLSAASLLFWIRWFPRPEAGKETEAAGQPSWERPWIWEIYYDSLNYHLALPNLYLLKGRIVATPHQIFSGLPFGGQMLYGLALALSDEKLASLLHASFGLASAGLIYLIGRRWLSPLQGFLAALLYYTLPLGMYASWSSGVDHIGVFYCAAGLFSLFRGLEDVPGIGWQAVSGLLLGFGAGTKYNILTMPVVLACVQAFLDRRAGLSWKRSLILLAAAGAAFFPWMLKNLAFFGNPLYPFLTGILPGAERIADPAGFFSASRAMDPSSILSSAAGFKTWALQQGNVFLGDWSTGDWPGPLLPLFAPWALWVPWKRPVDKALLGCAVLGYLAWAATSGLGRFLLPAYPALSLFLAAAVCHARWPAVMRGCGLLAILYGCLFHIQVAVKQSWNMEFWGYLAGRVSREEFILRPHETYALPYYPAAMFINRELPQDSRVLVLGESRTFYIERETVAASVFDHNPFWDAVRRSRTSADLRQDLAAMGVTHILVNAYQFLYRKSSAAVLPRDLAGSQAYRQFWQEYLEVLFEDRHEPNPQPGWLIVYKVLPEPLKVPASHVNPAFFAVKALQKMEAEKKAR